MKPIYVDLKGGLGLNFSFLRVAKALQTRGYKISVITPYWDIFAAANIPFYKPNEFRDFIFDAKSENAYVATGRIYDQPSFIFKKLNYKYGWIKFLGLGKSNFLSHDEYNHLDFSPEKTFPSLISSYNGVIDRIKKAGYEDYILVQFSGGQSPLDIPPEGEWSKKPYDCTNEPLKRYYPVDKAQKFVDLYKEARPRTAVIQYSLPNEPILQGVIRPDETYLLFYMLSKHSKHVVCIDISLQHMASGNCPVTVIWGHSLPDTFGYTCNKNIVQKIDAQDTWITIYAKDVRTNRLFVNTKNNDTWLGWQKFAMNVNK